jgi:hypothetical protein
MTVAPLRRLSPVRPSSIRACASRQPLWAAEDPPLVKRLREEGVPQLVEPQTLRFTGERYLGVAQFERVRYAPEAPITADVLTPSAAEELARDVMLFQQTASAACYITAGLPFYDRDLQSWVLTTTDCWPLRAMRTAARTSTARR